MLVNIAYPGGATAFWPEPQMVLNATPPSLCSPKNNWNRYFANANARLEIGGLDHESVTDRFCLYCKAGT